MSEAVAVVRASRPNFLVLAPLCVGLGVAVAWQQGEAPALLDTLLVFVGALLAHASVNLLNEYEDFISGLDLITSRTPFSGGSGALPEVPGAAKRVLVAAIGTLALVILIGLYFLWQRGLPMLVLGTAGVMLVLTYTRWITRSPLLCLFAPGIGFGPVMILGTLVALGTRLDATAITVSVISLLLVSELLLINQIPDVEADRKIGRRHLVITLGTRAAARFVSALFVSGYVVLVTSVFAGWLPLPSIMSLATAPFALWLAWKLPGVINQPAALNVLLGANVAILLATLALLIVGLSL
ncbi:1,4-dihydroxy-2-naphthoate octaprenyltransferase [Marinobacter antarcticus]|uniref:1,4-dihydroxy-2-naphthoate octaprenyltransferase n=1 Tax=Marinobacter antarcticus TaxID=564117 RepID=A0A1M6Q6L1_9GAMM|nr:prenyltransferase [Marinobacter antarcticus]SHK15924.1 1,4-dihydroxy-2-naphthoate octaprenyltransferase [Marinobacter antarcticus]